MDYWIIPFYVEINGQEWPWAPRFRVDEPEMNRYRTLALDALGQFRRASHMPAVPPQGFSIEDEEGLIVFRCVGEAT